MNRHTIVSMQSLLLATTFYLGACPEATDPETEVEDDRPTDDPDRRAETNEGRTDTTDRRDTGVLDTGMGDTGVVDSGAVDQGETNTTVPDTTAPDTGSTLDTGGTADTTVAPDVGGNTARIGSSCNCDVECATTGANTGACVNGICVQVATAPCSASGSSAECQPGSRCWQYSETVSYCWADCPENACAGQCDEDGSCVFLPDSTCDETCSSVCVAPYNGEPVECPPHSHNTTDGCACDTGYVVNEARDGCIEDTGTGGQEPGSACGCDDDCAGTTSNPGVCLDGVCMQYATGECASLGSQTECPSGSRCWAIQNTSTYICWPDCDSHACAGYCDADGSCAASDATSCDATCTAPLCQ